MIQGPLAIYISAVAIFEALGQSMLAWARKSKNNYWIFVGMSCYCVVAYGLYMAYKYKGVGMVNALWSSISILLMVTIGHTFFKERFDIYELTGIALIILGIIAINMGGDTKY